MSAASLRAARAGTFELDAALVLFHVDPRRACAELYRLLAGEVAAYSRALGVTDLDSHLDRVFDLALGRLGGFVGHGRDFRIEVLRIATNLAPPPDDDPHGDHDGEAGIDLGAAVLQGVLGLSVADAASVTGRSITSHEAGAPAPTEVGWLGDRFRVVDAPPTGPATAAHLGPHAHQVARAASIPPTGPARPPRPTYRRRAVVTAVLALLGVAGMSRLVGLGAPGDEVTSLATSSADARLTEADPRDGLRSPEAERDPDLAADTAATPAADTAPTWSHDVGAAGRVSGTIDADGHLRATVEAASGWSVEVDEATPPWFQATFDDGTSRIRFLAIADQGVVRVWTFDLGAAGAEGADATDTELAAPPATAAVPTPPPPPPPTPRPTAPPPRPAPPVERPDRPDPTPTPHRQPDPAASPDDPTPGPTPHKPEGSPTPDEPDEPDTTPTPDEPDTSPTPDDPDEPDTTPTPDEHDGDRSDNSGPGRGGGRDKD